MSIYLTTRRLENIKKIVEKKEFKVNMYIHLDFFNVLTPRIGGNFGDYDDLCFVYMYIFFILVGPWFYYYCWCSFLFSLYYYYYGDLIYQNIIAYQLKETTKTAYAS